MELSLKGRTALVSGASAGIGSGIAQVLAAEGARIAITARRHDLLEQLASKISGSGAEAPVVVTGDVTDLTGNVTDLSGNVTGLYGDVTDFPRGDYGVYESLVFIAIQHAYEAGEMSAIAQPAQKQGEDRG